MYVCREKKFVSGFCHNEVVMKVEYIKLSTGEEIISQTEPAGDHIILKNAVLLVMTREGTGMMPFAPFAKDQRVSLSIAHVMAVGEPEDEIKNAYNSKFGSGIVVAPSGLQIG